MSWPHTDLVDLALFVLAPAVLLCGLLAPALRVVCGVLSLVLLGALLGDLSQLLPFPDVFATADVRPSRAALALALAGGVLALLPVFTPRRALFVLASLLCAPSLTTVVFATAAVSASNPLVEDAPHALGALSRAGEMLAALDILVAVTFACAPRVRGWRAAGQTALVLVLGGAAWIWSPAPTTVVLGAAALVLTLVGRREALCTSLRVRVAGLLAHPGLPLLVGAALVALLGLGVLAAFGALPSALLTKQSSSGWLRVGSARFLPLTGVYVLLPLLLTSLSVSLRPLALWPHHWRGAALVNVVPGWLWLALGATGATVVALLAQGETGLSVLVGLAFVTWSVMVTLRMGLVAAGMLLAAGATLRFAGMVIYTCILAFPSALALFGSELERLGWIVFGVDDARVWQPVEAMSAVREAGLWGMGFLDPGGPGFTAPAWSNDLLLLTTARFTGAAGAVALLVAALLPALAVLDTARRGDFETDLDHSRFFALYAAPWAVAWGGACLWVAAGSVRVVPLSGVSLGLSAPSTNHLLFTLLVAGWVVNRSQGTPHDTVKNSGSPILSSAGLRRTLGVVSWAMIAGVLAVAWAAWSRLGDRAEVHLLPADVEGSVSVEQDGDGVRVNGVYAPIGSTFAIDSLRLQVLPGPSVAIVGFTVGGAALDRGVHLGSAGPGAPPHPMGRFTETVALWNDIWLDRTDAVTRYRELTLAGRSGQVEAIAPADGSSITVIALDGGECVARDAGDPCLLTEGARVDVRGAYRFVAHPGRAGLTMDWEEGAPTPWAVTRERPLRLGGRSIAALEVRDQVYDRASRPVLALLGQYGVLQVRDGVLGLGPLPELPEGSRGSERALVEAARYYHDLWIRRSGCDGHGAWRGFRDPVAGGPCLSDAAIGRLWIGEDGSVLDVRTPNTLVFAALDRPEGTTRRGLLLDRYGTPLVSFVADEGWVPVEPSLGWLGTRELRRRDGVVDGTFSYAQRILHNLLSGRSAVRDPMAELRRRWRMEPRPAGADVRLTLSLPIQRAAAAAAAQEALALVTASTAARLQEEKRACLAYDVSVVVSSEAGDILAAVTAVGDLDERGAPRVSFESGAARHPCLPPFDGALRAFSAPERVGSPWKLAVYGAALDAALGGDPDLRFVQREGGLYLLDPGDPENSDGTYVIDRGTLERVKGIRVPCTNHGEGEPGYGPMEVLSAIARSQNVPVCYVGTLLGGERMKRLIELLQADGVVPLFPPTQDPSLDRWLLPDRYGLFAVGGDARVLRDGRITAMEAGKIGLGKDVLLSVLQLGALGRTIVADGTYTAPRLWTAVRFADGQEVPVPSSVGHQVFDPRAAAQVRAGMELGAQSLVPGLRGTSAPTFAELDEARRPRVIGKTGTPDLNAWIDGHVYTLPSHKTAVVAYPDDSPDPAVIAVFARHAQRLDDRAALKVARELIAGGWLDSPAQAP